jgi:hypothetical protein
MDTKQHEWGFGGRVRHSVRAVVARRMPGAHGVTRATKYEFNSRPLVFIPFLKIDEC